MVHFLTVMISRVTKWLALSCFLGLHTSQAFAWVEPGISFSPAFSTLKTTDSIGTEIKLSSATWYQIQPELLWHLSREGHGIRLRGHFERLVYDPPAGVTLTATSFSLFGGDLQYQVPMDKFLFGAGIEGNQVLLINVSNAVTATPKTSYYLDIPFEASYNLVVLERQVLKLGLGAMAVLPVSPDVSSGYRFTPSLGYELRGEIRSQIHFFYDLRHLNASTGSRDETTIGLLLKLSFPGRQGLIPSPDERT